MNYKALYAERSENNRLFVQSKTILPSNLYHKYVDQNMCIEYIHIYGSVLQDGSNIMQDTLI